jgi:biotin-dependent carboxylase-like uncharacterized protein
MSVRIIQPGLQTTVQSGARTGLRHLGVPASGAADPLSLALANHLLGNALSAPGLELTLSPVSLRFETAMDFALTGAMAEAELNDSSVGFHETLSADVGDVLSVNSFASGARVYIAFGGSVAADEILGSASTYLPAAIGGFHGRALRKDDLLEIRTNKSFANKIRTPIKFRLPLSRSWALRACRSGETSLLANQDSIFNINFVVGNRADRMGMVLQGTKIEIASDGRMPSAAVFPGTVQCPEDGQPYLLSVDAQTTGGYPRVAQVIRADRHLLGQIRPGDKVRLLLRDEAGAKDDLRAKIHYWEEWLPNVAQVM